MTITFMRHAESQHNANGILAGTTDIPCTELGLTEAHALSKNFNNDFDAYYVSPLTRTRQTASTVVPNTEFTVDNRLIERCFGIWENMPLSDIGEQPFIDVIFKDVPLEGCETNAEVESRITSFLEYLKETHKETDKILAVTHGGIIIVLQQKFAQNQEIPHNLGTLTIEI